MFLPPPPVFPMISCRQYHRNPKRLFWQRQGFRRFLVICQNFQRSLKFSKLENSDGTGVNLGGVFIFGFDCLGIFWGMGFTEFTFCWFGSLQFTYRSQNPGPASAKQSRFCLDPHLWHNIQLCLKHSVLFWQCQINIQCSSAQLFNCFRPMWCWNTQLMKQSSCYQRIYLLPEAV